MIVDGVNFVEKQVKMMSKKKFIDTHMTCIWQKVAEENRRKKLSDVYDRIAVSYTHLTLPTIRLV